MRLDDRAAALLALVETDRAARARAIEEPAERQAREELAQARHAARQRVCTAIAEERSAFAARVASAEARLATARRMARQRRLKALLAEGWERLPRALAARWADADAREAWTCAVLECAAAVLARAPWTIEGPASWSEEERARAQASLAERGIEALCTATSGIEAGLRVSCRNVEVDATLAGLLGDRAAVEGRLLDLLEREGEAA